jgi:hypothetical protein
MALSESLALEVGSTLRGPRCTVCALRSRLNQEDCAAFDAALSDATVTSSAIQRALKREGHAIGDIPLRRHRRGDCAGGQGAA